MQTVIWNEKRVTSSKVICVGRNYVDHIVELGNELPSAMVLFAKPNSAISMVLHVSDDRELHYEGEICFMVENNEIVAVGFGLDLTDRALQSELKAKGLPWERAKAFDGAAVLSSFVSIGCEAIEHLGLELWINDRLVQKGDVTMMLYKPIDIIQEIRSFMRLEDGDIIMSGTPKGVGTYKKGDVFIGKLFIKDKEILSHQWIAQSSHYM